MTTASWGLDSHSHVASFRVKGRRRGSLVPRCICGHTYGEHIPLPGHPDGVEECQAARCTCGQWRPEVLR
jgi:hypothetical protein